MSDDGYASDEVPHPVAAGLGPVKSEGFEIGTIEPAAGSSSSFDSKTTSLPPQPPHSPVGLFWREAVQSFLSSLNVLNPLSQSRPLRMASGCTGLWAEGIALEAPGDAYVIT
jgi:hypothetical protein